MKQTAGSTHFRDDVSTGSAIIEDGLRIHCRRCAAHYLVPKARIESMDQSTERLVGYVRCTAGHLVIHQFTEAYPKRETPASTAAFRSQLAAAERMASEWVSGRH